MTTPGAIARLLSGAVAAVAVAVVIGHHVGYFRRRRPLTFGAFLETTGWIIITLCAIAALGGGLVQAGTRAAEIAAAITGAFFIAIGRQFT